MFSRGQLGTRADYSQLYTTREAASETPLSILRGGGGSVQGFPREHRLGEYKTTVDISSSQP